MEDVVSAADRIREHIYLSPCVPSHLQEEFVIHLYYKEELLQKTGCFKERGVLNALQLLPADKKKIGVVIASLGNEAVSLCYHAAKMNVPVIVVMPPHTPIMKQQRCHSLGARVILQGASLIDAQRYARAIAREKGLTYINSRDHPHILAGYGTIALEVLEQVPFVDALIVPVGQGGLVSAIAAVVKQMKPHCQVYGVQTEAMAPFFESLKVGAPVTVVTQPTMADAIAVPAVGVNSLHNALPLVDKMLLVKEEWIARAMLHLIEKEKLIVEGAGACPLAAVLGNIVPELKTKHVVCILSGGNVDSLTLNRCIDRGLAADYRLVKFTVGINNNTFSNAQLLKLLAAGGYSVLRQFRDNSWCEDETYTVEIRLVCETKGLEHSLELKRVIERAYPLTSTFETEPFNDKRTCPCYVRKIRDII
ncbi:L-threonine ammonia-lyase isoform X2 [Amyelois transitella]|nr:L-threonine ammonia-lyase isoform X2 [Amyelois transitella]